MIRQTIGWIAVFVGVVALLGCEKPTTTKNTKPAATTTGHSHDHSHDEGPHGGVLAEWGEEVYHVEFTVDHAKKQVVVYLLDEHAVKTPKVEPSDVKNMTLTITNVKPPLTLELKHDAALSGPKGMAFVVTHDQFGKEMDFNGNISGNVKGQAYSGDFKETGGHKK